MVEKIFTWLGSHSEKRPAWVILIILLITVLAVIGATRIKTELGYKAMLPKKAESVKTLNEAEEIFGGTAEEQVLIEAGNVLDATVLRKVAAYPQFLKGKKDIWGRFASAVTTPLDDMVYFPGNVLPAQTGSAAGTGAMSQISQPLLEKLGSLSDEELVAQVKLNLEYARIQAARVGLSVGQQNISENGRALLMSVALNPKLKTADQMKIVKSFEKDTRAYFKGLPGSKTYITGLASMNYDSNQRMMNDSKLLFMLAFVFVIIVLFITFRRLTDILLTVLVIILTIIWVIGLSGWLNFPYTYNTAAIFPLMLGVDIAYAIHVLSRYYEERRKGSDTYKAALTSVATVGVAVFLTAATTAFGFASFGISNMPPIQQFGGLCVAGVLFSFVLAVTLLPATLVLRDRRGKAQEKWEKKQAESKENNKDSWLDRLLVRVAIVSEHHKRFVMIITVAVLVGCGLLSLRITTEADMEKMQPQDLPSAVASSQIYKYFGGQDVAYTLVRGDILQPENLKAMLKYEDELAATKYVNEKGKPLFERDKIFSIADIVQKKVGSIPPTKAEVISTLLSMSQGRKAGSKSNGLVNNDASVAMVTIRITRGSQSDMKHMADTMRSKSKEIVGEHKGLTMSSSGLPVLMIDLMSSILPTQLKTSGLALIMCALVVILVFRSLFFGLAAASVVLLGIALEIGALSLLNWPLDFMTVMVSSLVIGAGIDFGIHITHRFREEWHYGGVEIDEAMRRTMRNVGKAVVAAAVTTAGAFGIIAISKLTYLKRFGGITALSLTFALLAALLVLPSILAWRAQRVEKVREKKQLNAGP